MAYALNEGTAEPLREYHDSPPNMRRLSASLSSGADGCWWSIGRIADTKSARRSIQPAERVATKAAGELAYGATILLSWRSICPRAYSGRMARQSDRRGNFVMPRSGKCNLAGNARYYAGNASQSARLAALRVPPMIQTNIAAAGCS